MIIFIIFYLNTCSLLTFNNRLIINYNTIGTPYIFGKKQVGKRVFKNMIKLVTHLYKNY